jgi:hypothetical protein
LGKPLQGTLEKQEFDQQFLHDFNMGYLTPATMTPHSSVRFIEEENKFTHPWSIKHIGQQYGYARLKDIIPLQEYLNLPAYFVEDLIEGIVTGSDRRARQEAERQPEGGQPTKEQREVEQLLKKEGLL